MNMSPISISYTSDELKEKAEDFAKSAGYPLVPTNEVTSPINLNYTNDFVELCDKEKNINIHIDFISGDLAHRQKYGGGRGQSIAKAIGLKQGTPPPSVLDATAGLAKDAYVLACLGCSMTLVERSTIIIELMKKEDQNREKFILPVKLKELYEAKDYGRYGKDGTLWVNFISNNDITGGNSGSPVMNSRGELIGCAFDGNWEAMSGDIAFEKDFQRTISADIRYILFVIDKYAGATHLIDEMTIIE